MPKAKSQKDLILSYFKKNANKNIPHAEVVDWAVTKWEKLTGNKFRDPDRAIRSLHDKGLLVKVSKGVYCYDPDFAKEQNLQDFTAQQKEEIFSRDEYKCVMCGAGKKNGIEIHADHICPRSLGGESTIENGQTLCAQHNFKKKAYKQTETGKKMFIRLYELAAKKDDSKTKAFCQNILEIYEKHDINGHIPWDKKH